MKALLYWLRILPDRRRKTRKVDSERRHSGRHRAVAFNSFNDTLTRIDERLHKHTHPK